MVRAGIAGGLTSLAWLASRPSDRWYFLLVGGAAFLAWNPYNLLDPGFQLSFSAVAAIFLLVPRLERRLEGYPVPSRLATVLAVSAGCGVATAPILWLHFGAVPILSVLANALAAPVVAPILGFGLAAAAVEAPCFRARRPRSAGSTVGSSPTWRLAPASSEGSRLRRSSPASSSAHWPGSFAFVAVLRRAPRSWRRPALAAALAIAALAAGWKLWPRPPALPPPTGLRISFLDVGQGDSALFQVPQGAVLVDQGPPEARVAARLGRLGLRKLAVLVLTHPQQRSHRRCGRRSSVASRSGSCSTRSSPTRARTRTRRSTRRGTDGVRLVAARAGDTLRLGDLRLRVLWPDGPGLPGEDPNRHPIVLLASYGHVDALLTADAESEVTGALPLPRVEILKVAHHGSEDPGLRGLLERAAAPDRGRLGRC